MRTGDAPDIFDSPIPLAGILAMTTCSSLFDAADNVRHDESHQEIRSQ